MTIRTDLLSAASAILVAVTDATDAKIIYAGEDGPRPAKPYLTLRLSTPGGGTHGPAERLDGLNGSTPQATMRERREAVVSVQGYGSGALTWLDQMQIDIDHPVSLTAQKAANVEALLQSAATDLSAILDTSEEPRSSLELRLRYQYDGSARAQVELLRTEVSVELERYDGDPDTLDADFALDASGDLTA